MSSEVPTLYLLCKLLTWFPLMKIQYMNRMLAMLPSFCTMQYMFSCAAAEVVY